MQSFTKPKNPFLLLIAIVILASPLSAQQKRSAPPPKKAVPAVAPEPAPTFDTLLSNETYKVYSEVRGVGALIRSTAVQDLLEPVIKLAAPPREFKTVLKWLSAHADALAGSRMMVASWPSRPTVPNIIMAVEFSNAEEALKFERELRAFIPTMVPTPMPAPVDSSGPGRPSGSGAQSLKENEPALPPYHIKQSGSLVLIADKPIEFGKLRTRGTKLLEEDSNFALARNRFASESLFLYIDFKSIEKEEKDRRQKWEQEEQRRTEIVANSRKAEDSSGQLPPQIAMDSTLEVYAAEPPPRTAEPPVVGSAQATLGTTSSNNATPTDTAVPSASDAVNSKEAAEMSGAFYSLNSIFFGGQPNWPEAVAAAVVFEGDAYVVRALIVDGGQTKPNAVPFIPQFISGPALVPRASSIFPADTALFGTLSLDYAQIYEEMLRSIAAAEESARRYRTRPGGDPDYSQPDSPFAIYEKKLGIKIKDDLLPLLGNEFAFALPRAAPVASTSNAKPQPAEEKNVQKNAGPFEPNPVIAVALKDKEGVRRLIPKLIESMAFKGANLFAQNERRGETEITSYANIVSYAFVGDFLVISADSAAIRHVVDFYLSHQTLSSDTHFRNSTRWQPRQVLGSVYVAPDIMQRYYPDAAGAPASDRLKEFLLRLGPEIEPVTYSLSNEGLGPLHELHVPKNLLMLLIAGMSSPASQSPLITNEAMAKGMMRTVVAAEATFQATEGDGRYGSLDELLAAGLISKESIQKYGYRIEVTASSNKFEATAVPIEYGVTGTFSYFTDESGVVRGGDHGGGAATISDKEIDK